MAFTRWISLDKYTYAFRLFSKYHTHMNSLYWSHVPATSYAQWIFRNAKKVNPEQTTQEMFHLSGEDAYRVTKSLDEYSKHLKDFSNWTRLNTLVSVLSYFETYLSSVVSLSIESDLGILYSIPKKIDGAMVLKYGTDEDYSFFDKSQGVTKGSWTQRISKFRELFVEVPESLENNISELEKMRRIRNNVAHAFGRDIDEARARHTLEVLPIDRLSEKRLKKYMQIIRRISKDIDNQLSRSHIGEFELVHYYHNAKKNINPDMEAAELKKLINSLYVETRNRAFCEELISYYESL